MTTAVLAVVAAAVIGLAVLALVLMARLRGFEGRAVTAETLDQRLEAQIGRLLESDHSILQVTANAFGDLKRELGGMEEASRHLLELGRDVTRLEKLLQPPQLRGGVGEIFLEQVLHQVLPDEHYELKHCFCDGTQVDAAVRIGDGLVPIDAKFPLDAFRRLLDAEGDKARATARKDLRRDVRGHVDAIAGKYIKPTEGTYDFALMYIPAESVYYEAVIGDTEGGLLAYMLQRHVVPVSPNCLYAYLLVIVHGLRGMHVEKRAAEIIRFLDQLRGEVERFQKDYGVLGGHLRDARSKYDDAQNRLDKIGANLESRSQGTLDTANPSTLGLPPSTPGTAPEPT